MATTPAPSPAVVEKGRLEESDQSLFCRKIEALVLKLRQRTFAAVVVLKRRPARPHFEADGGTEHFVIGCIVIVKILCNRPHFPNYELLLFFLTL